MKLLFRTALGCIYIAALLFCLVIVVKPGSALFYSKTTVEPQILARDGNAFAYPLKANPRVFNPDSVLVLEDTRVLQKSVAGYTTTEGIGTFALKAVSENGVTVLFAPTLPSNPASNGHTYRVYIKPYLFASVWGNAGFLLLLLGLVGVYAPVLADPQKRKRFFASPASILKPWAGLLDRPKRKDAGSSARPALIPNIGLWKQTAVNTALLAYFYVLMEWIFFATKPSFMDLLSLGGKVRVLLLSGCVAAFISLFCLFLAFLLDSSLARIFPAVRGYARHVPAAFLTACLCLILFDNFTYTIFKLGVISTRTFGRILYELGFIGGFVYILRSMACSTAPAKPGGMERAKTIGSVFLFGIALILAGFSFQPAQQAGATAAQSAGQNQKPNIILFGSDGMNAANMSVYGYERDTTPFLRELAKTSLVGDNNFNNADHSLGSDTSLLTGKLPLVTRVYTDPSILQGADMYLHLPGLLRQNGYRTVQLAVPDVVDANRQNFQNAFDEINCQKNTADRGSNNIFAYSYYEELYFLNTIQDRIQDRLEHIFFIKDMANTYKQVTEGSSDSISDEQHIECLQTYLNNAKRTGQPLFAHIHLIGTHGSRFTPQHPTFSKGEIQTDGWMADFYDDAILDYDTQVRQLVLYLQDNGQYDNTILILYTDHSQKYSTIHRIPLLIHFPNDQHAGVIAENTQNLDMAPTILDYMGIAVPDWMGGSSLLAKLDPSRLIIASGSNKVFEPSQSYALPGSNLDPQLDQFHILTVIQCQNWYVFDLKNRTLRSGTIAGYAHECPADRLDTREEIQAKVGKMLTQLGYSAASK